MELGERVVVNWGRRRLSGRIVARTREEKPRYDVMLSASHAILSNLDGELITPVEKHDAA